MSLLDRLVRLHVEGCNPRTGEPPDFLLIPWAYVGDLEGEMAAVCTFGERNVAGSFMARMVRGEVKCNDVPVHPGDAFGYGYKAEPVE